MDLETYLHKQAVLKKLRYNLQLLEMQLANDGGEMNTSIKLVNDINNVREDIYKIEIEIDNISLSLMDSDPIIREKFQKLMEENRTVYNENGLLRTLITVHMARYKNLKSAIDLAAKYGDHAKNVQMYMETSKFSYGGVELLKINRISYILKI